MGKDYILLEYWNTMSKAEQQEVLSKAYPKSKFHFPNSDCISWSQWTWNPITGCLQGCDYCFARDRGQQWVKSKFEPAFYPRRLQCPQHTKLPTEAETDISYKNVFTCNLADLFGKWVPSDLIKRVLEAAAKAPQWNFLFLTKFPQRLLEFEYPDNAWVGTTVDTQARIRPAEEAFQDVRAKVKWLSCEPMLERLTFAHLDRFNWISIGGTIPRTKKEVAFTPPLEWVTHLRAQARDAGCRIYEEPNLNLVEPCREYPK